MDAPTLPVLLALIQRTVDAAAEAGIAARFVLLPERLGSFVEDLQRQTSLEVFTSPRGDQSNLYVFAEDPRHQGREP